MNDEYNLLEGKVIGILILENPDNRQNYINLLHDADFKNPVAKKMFQRVKDNTQVARPESLFFDLSQEDKQYCMSAMDLAELQFAHDTIDNFVSIAKNQSMIEQFNTALMNNAEISDLENIIETAKARQYIAKNSWQDYIEKYFIKPVKMRIYYKKLNAVLNQGILSGTILTIGARPSTGKTTFALNLLKSAVYQNKKAVFFSLEMSNTMIYDRIIADIMNIPIEKTINHDLSNDEFEKMQSLLQYYNDVQIIDDVSDIETIVNYVYANKPDVCFIDYIQIVNIFEKQFIDNRHKIDYISNQIKRCAKKTNTIFVILSQITRVAKENPTMSDLKESGSLEQDSDYVILLHRPYVNDKAENPNRTILKLDKNKFGKSIELRYNFESEYQRFVEE